jgi:predicted MFS family arabinose efflux permease
LTAVHAAALFVVATAPSVPVAAAGLFAAGAMENMTGIVQVSYRLSVIPDALQGRVNSSYRFVSYFGSTLGTAVGGVLLAALSAREVLALIAAAIGVISLAASATPLRRL